MLIIKINNRPLTGPMAVEKFVTKYSIFTFFSYTQKKKIKGENKRKKLYFYVA